MFGMPSIALPAHTKCRVLAWRDAAAWTQRYLTKANGGPNMVSHGGRPQAVLQKFWRRQVKQLVISPNILSKKKFNVA